ncbi:MAG: DUF1273 family protein [Clostridia bacterium]|nr:DUF1273 family protein [Clostridia bacterium]MBR2159949.1 DUF1273 family protein [Clostridia bacterium]
MKSVLLQTNIFTPKACVFTGHRGLEKDFSKRALKKAIETVIKAGVTTFYNGLACGFDLEACEAVLKLKKKNPQLRLIGCVPCLEQSAYYALDDQKRYEKICKSLDEKVQVSSTYYYNGCMQKRNRYMCDRADLMIAYCNRDKGGTASTVKYFQKTYPEKQVIFI